MNCERLSRNIWWSLSNLVGSTNGLLPIRDLNLSDCNLVDEDIPDDIKCLYLLEILDLSKNSFVRLKQSLTQLTNLKALYLNDCFNIQPQLLPKLPTSLQYVGGQNSKVIRVSLIFIFFYYYHYYIVLNKFSLQSSVDIILNLSHSST